MERMPPTIRRSRLPPKWRAVFALLLAASLAGCGSSEPDPVSSVAPQSSATSSALPVKKEIDREHPVIEIDTNQGTITVRLDAVRAPVSVQNFLNYANSGFYDQTIVHYVDPGQLIAAGGYNVDHSPKPPRLAIRNEAHNGLKNVRGTIAMARDQALIDSATSQFFINLTDAPQRDYRGDTPQEYGYCVFGQVIEGLDVAERISKLPTTNRGGDLLQTPDPAAVVTSIRAVR